MSAADLFEDGFPHGTVQGYDEGCHSGACPAKADVGMSCKMAWTASKGDRRYRNLIAEGAPPAVVALELGFTHEEALSDAARAQIDGWRSPVDTAEAETDTTPASLDTAKGRGGHRTVGDDATGDVAFGADPSVGSQ